MNVSPVLDRLPLLTESNSFSTVTGDSRMISGFAKAMTPFGPLAGRTPIHVEDGAGEDSARISFMCGQTPVSFVVADGNFQGLIRALIAQAGANTRAELEAEYDAALNEGAA